MLFSQSSNKLNALSATSFNSSVLQSSSSALSTGVADPVQQNDFRLKSSVSSLASTEFASSSASSVVSNRVFDQVSDVLVVDRGIPNKFKTGIDVLEDTSYNKVGHLLNPTLDDTLAGAFDMGRLDGKTRTRLDSIGNGDNTDYTHFRLDQASAFNLFLKGAAGDASVNLLDASGTTIASSYDGRLLLAQGISTTQNFDTHDIALNLSSLAAGDYYLKVSPFWSQHRVSGAIDRLYLPTATTTDYDLTVSTEQVSNLLPTEIDLGNLSGTPLLTGTLDSNNTSEMYRVTLGAGNLHITLSGMNANADVRLIKDSNNDGVVSGNEAFASSNQWYGFTDGIYNALKGGTYFIQVNHGQGSTGATINYNLGVSTGDWYTDNLSDFGVVAQARLAGVDGWIDRNEMMSVLRGTKDYGAIDATELADLRTVLSGLGHAMPDYVSTLANKVLNGDSANTRMGGSNIGNLSNNDSSEKMERLIGKWFLGSDRPVAMSTDGKTNYIYKPAQGQLFQNGISYTDVDQNALGDCYFLAGLAETALRTPNVLQDMFIANGDNTWTVRLFHDGIADYVTVDNWLPTTSMNPSLDSAGRAVFAGWGGGWSNDPTNELWVALAEKAYTQLNESGVIGQEVAINSYQAISGGFGKHALYHITGRGVVNGHVNWGFANQNDDIGKIVSAWNAHQLVTLSTNNDSDDVYANIVPGHQYALVGYDGNHFTLYNPWGINGGTIGGQHKDGFIILNKDQLMANFANWEATTA
ncbi:C2 family cysteine protease [Phormidesmis sp. 146-35]